MNRTFKIVVFFLISILVFCFVFRNEIIERIVLVVINHQLNESEDRVYDVVCGKVEVELIAGNISLVDIQVSPRVDSNFILKKKMNEFPFLVKGKLNRVTIKEFSWSAYWEHEELQVEEVIVVNPLVKLLLGDFKEEISDLESVEYTEAITQLFSSVKIEKVIIENCSVEVAKAFTPEKLLIDLDSLSFYFDHIAMDTVKSKRNPYWFFENLEFNMKSIKASLGGGYRMEAKNLSISASENSLSLEDIKVTPVHSKDKDSIKGESENYFTLFTSKIDFLGVNYKEIVRAGNIAIDKIDVADPKFQYLIDLVHIKEEQEATFLPTTLFRGIKTNISVGSLEVKNGEVELLMKTDHRNKPVSLYFDKVNGVTNKLSVGTDWYSSGVMETNIEAVFQKEAKLDLNLILPMYMTNDEFFIKGTLGEMSLKGLNPVVEATSFVTLSSGVIHQVDLEFIADNKAAEGRLLMDYSNLSLIFLKELTPSNSGRRRKYHIVDTYLGNNFIKRANNPKALFFREGYINVKREQTLNFWSYLWGSIETGVTHSLIKTSRKKKRKVKKYKKYRLSRVIYN